jgi:hypothetical protein|tara:strand:+ start:667 stop:1065 length:399 start_codon:yes stop_codon:yes gene_type:complete
MKYLSHYMEEGQSALFKEMKVFFAFNNKQFEEGLQKHNLNKRHKIVSMGHGMYCPKKNAVKVINGLEGIYKLAIEKDLKENGIEKIVLRELENHECFWSGEIIDCVEKLENYPVTQEYIEKIYFKYYKNYDL